MRRKVAGYFHITIPESGFSSFAEQKALSIISTRSGPFEEFAEADLTTSLRLIIVPDDVFAEILHSNAFDMSKVRGASYVYYDMEYVRKCRARSVISSEWRKNFGPDNIVDYTRRVENLTDQDRYFGDYEVTVLYLKRVSKSLTDFNKKYGKYFISQGR